MEEGSALQGSLLLHTRPNKESSLINCFFTWSSFLPFSSRVIMHGAGRIRQTNENAVRYAVYVAAVRETL
jgi:hypothetical protein